MKRVLLSTAIFGLFASFVVVAQDTVPTGTEVKTETKVETQVQTEKQETQSNFVQQMKDLNAEYKEGKITKAEYKKKKKELTREHAKVRKEMKKQARKERKAHRKNRE